MVHLYSVIVSSVSVLRKEDVGGSKDARCYCGGKYRNFSKFLVLVRR